MCTSAVSYKSSPLSFPLVLIPRARPLARRTCRLGVDARLLLLGAVQRHHVSKRLLVHQRSILPSRAHEPHASIHDRAVARATERERRERARFRRVVRRSGSRGGRPPLAMHARAARRLERAATRTRDQRWTLNVSRRRARSTTTTRTARDGVRTRWARAQTCGRGWLAERGDDESEG